MKGLIMTSAIRMAVTIIFAVFSVQMAVSQEMAKLRIGLLPGESAPTVVRLNQALEKHLERQLGMEVELIVGSDYAATGEALRFGRIDVAFLGPVTYVLQRERAGIEPFAKPHHAEVGATFQAAIIARRDSGIKSLVELAAKDIAFGDPASTSGTWVPRYQLLSADLVAGRDYNAHYLGAHDAVALAVQNGKAAAGGISLPIFERLVSEGKIDGKALMVVELSAPIPEYSWTFREDLDKTFREKIREAFLSLSDAPALNVFRADSFVPSRDDDYEIVREWVTAVKSSAPQ
jgi:phosphonate transport system substrate-binding protein